MEVWWDSSPLVFEGWVAKTVSAAAPNRRAELDGAVEALVRGPGSGPQCLPWLHHQPAAVAHRPQERSGLLEQAYRRDHRRPARHHPEAVVLEDLPGGDPQGRGDDAASLGGIPRPLRLCLRPGGPAPDRRGGSHAPAGGGDRLAGAEHHGENSSQPGRRGRGAVPDFEGDLHERNDLLYHPADHGGGPRGEGGSGDRQAKRSRTHPNGAP